MGEKEEENNQENIEKKDRNEWYTFDTPSGVLISNLVTFFVFMITFNCGAKGYYYLTDFSKEYSMHAGFTLVVFFFTIITSIIASVSGIVEVDSLKQMWKKEKGILKIISMIEICIIILTVLGMIR